MDILECDVAFFCFMGRPAWSPISIPPTMDIPECDVHLAKRFIGNANVDLRIDGSWDTTAPAVDE